MGYIYKITNLINNKCYIGRTTAENIERRWTEHKSKSKRNPKTVIEYAIAKYGPDNFRFEQLIEANNEELPRLETENIIKYNTFNGNGYNVELYQPLHRILVPESLEKMSKSQQGHPVDGKSSKYLGVYKEKKSWYVELAKNRKKYKRVAENELDAAIKYDKLALSLYGGGAKLNFEENRNKWNEKDLSDFMANFHFKRPSIAEQHCYFDKSRNKWVSRVKFNSKYLHLGRFLTKEEAINKRLEKLKESPEYS